MDTEFNNELSQQQLIFRQIERYQRTWSKMDQKTIKKAGGKVKQKNNVDLVHAQAWQHAKGLKSLIKPKLDDEQRRKIKNAGDPDNPGILFDKCLQLLTNHNMLYEDDSDFVIEDSSSKLEPEESDISEEVVE